MHPELRKHNARHEQPSHANIHDKEAWPADDLRRFCQCIKFNRYEIFKQAKAMLSSIVTSGEVALGDERSFSVSRRGYNHQRSLQPISEAMEYI